jgi:hypothetical protein
VGTVILTPGFKEFAAGQKGKCGYGGYPSRRHQRAIQVNALGVLALSLYRLCGVGEEV